MLIQTAAARWGWLTPTVVFPPSSRRLLSTTVRPRTFQHARLASLSQSCRACWSCRSFTSGRAQLGRPRKTALVDSPSPVEKATAKTTIPKKQKTVAKKTSAKKATVETTAKKTATRKTATKRVVAKQASTEQTAAELTAAEPTAVEPTAAEQTSTEPTAAEAAPAEPTAAETAPPKETPAEQESTQETPAEGQVVEEPVVEEPVVEEPVVDEPAAETVAKTAAVDEPAETPDAPTDPIPASADAAAPPPKLESLLKLSDARFNDIGIQLLPSHLHQQLFPSGAGAGPTQTAVELSKKHLIEMELLGTADDASVRPIGFDLPKLIGPSLTEHFNKIGQYLASDYLRIAQKFAIASIPARPKPRKWIVRSGWTKYLPDGTSRPVAAPEEDAFTFDVEVMYNISEFAVMATAVSSSAWYAWLSPWLLGESESLKHLVPLGDPQLNRVVVGHNVGFDRARVREEYSLSQTRSFFLDTMSLHVSVNGMCSRQRPMWMKHRKEREQRNQEAIDDPNPTDPSIRALLDIYPSIEGGGPTENQRWLAVSSVNSLDAVAQFHCGIKVDKSIRDSFGKIDRPEALERVQELLDYCAGDADVTHQVYAKVFPSFLEMCPHPVSFYALRALASVILPVNKSWETYISTAEKVYQEREDQIINRLVGLAKAAVALRDKPEIYTADPWLSQLDWSGQEVRMTKGSKKEPPRPVARQKAPGMPKWWKELLTTPTSTEPTVTLRTRIASALMRLTWAGYPILWSGIAGFVYRVPRTEASKMLDAGIQPVNMAMDEDPVLCSDVRHVYFRIPHKDGPAARCSNPLAKNYLKQFEDGMMKGADGDAKEIVELSTSCSYWISSRERIRRQMVVYKADIDAMAPSKPEPKPELKPEPKRRGRKSAASSAAAAAAPTPAPAESTDGVDPHDFGFILPQIIPMGTVTRRAVEPTWLTASNAKPNRVGSELKSLVKAPPGYTFVGADVDSEELWIACLLGDAQFGMHGATALGYMTLVGSKKKGTDLHSRTAGLLGISRDAAKVFNYGRIYGAGAVYATTLLRQFNPAISDKEADETSKRLYAKTKGRRTTRASIHGSRFWRGGSESAVFNMLEGFASSAEPRTPVLGAGITQALRARNVGKAGFLPSRINWAIQSSGVDYLHLLVVAMEWMCTLYQIPARLAITIHDEIRYLVPESDRYRTALALQVANLWVRCVFAESAGISDLPLCVAFFSAVDIDRVLRKEVYMDCITPSQPTPIPPGENADIEELLDKGIGLERKPTPPPSSSSPAPSSSPTAEHNDTFVGVYATALSDAAEKLKCQPFSRDATPTMKIVNRKGRALRDAFLMAQMTDCDKEMTAIVKQARKSTLEAERLARAMAKANADKLAAAAATSAASTSPAPAPSSSARAGRKTAPAGQKTKVGAVQAGGQAAGDAGKAQGADEDDSSSSIDWASLQSLLSATGPDGSAGNKSGDAGPTTPTPPSTASSRTAVPGAKVVSNTKSEPDMIPLDTLPTPAPYSKKEPEQVKRLPGQKAIMRDAFLLYGGLQSNYWFSDDAFELPHPESGFDRIPEFPPVDPWPQQ